MTPAEKLRDAATRLREYSNEATEGPWEMGYVTPANRLERIPAYADLEPSVAGGLDPADAAYMATMHPGVGLALADWLDAAAQDLELRGGSMHLGYAGVVARRVLGDES